MKKAVTQQMLANSDSSFIPNSCDEKNKVPDERWLNKKRKARLKAKLVSTKHYGSWSKQENQIYIKFLEDNLDDFMDEHLRRTKKVFNKLSKLLPNRTSDQCRSHHQKLQISAGSELPEDIIEHLKEKIKNKKEKARVKTTEKEGNDLKVHGFIITTTASKEIRVILNEINVDLW